MNKVRFSVFSDLHHYDIWCGDTEERLDAILQRAKEKQSDFIIHLGDLCHWPTRETAFLKKYNSFEIPTYHVLDNHDMDHTNLEDVVAAYGMPAEYYFFDKNGFRFIVLNANYLRIDGEDIPYSAGNYGHLPQYRNHVSQEQIKWLEETIMSSPYPVVVFSHGSLSLEDYQTGDGLKNREDIMNIFRKAHKNGKRVLMCLNGHMHVDYMRIYEHVCYLDINSATMYWVPAEHHMFPKEFHEAHRGAKSIAIYNDPIHAIITLSEDGTIEVEGMESDWFCGITPHMITGKTCHQSIRPTAKVMTETIKLPLKL